MFIFIVAGSSPFLFFQGLSLVAVAGLLLLAGATGFFVTAFILFAEGFGLELVPVPFEVAESGKAPSARAKECTKNSKRHTR